MKTQQETHVTQNEKRKKNYIMILKMMISCLKINKAYLLHLHKVIDKW